MAEPKKNILITGGTGLIGTRLTQLLLDRGDNVIHLGRSNGIGSVPAFRWNVRDQKIDEGAFKGVDTVVHLAGANVGDERWTVARKKEILDSRLMSAELLRKTLGKIKHDVRTLVSASAIGYYGFDGNQLFTEESPPSNDFLASVTGQWENAVDKMNDVVSRVVKLRIGIVLSDKAGALKEIATPVKYFVGAPLGSGDQQISWIHIDDVCGMFMKAIDDSKMVGAFNAVAPNPVSNRELTKAIGKTLKRPVIFPAVPPFVLRLMLGEMAEIVLRGSRVSPTKIIQAGYKFRFPSLQPALEDLLKSGV